ncbi:hypothetical protein [Granulicella sibirica]|uniref:Uncharacterized protein n=1 Tax=Granulicella sibirica TaxID=2479048 RepID=A0A4Q0T606_9BACT|nr:hypothetical protein [Granulicella sibirica]RXH58432.1 hypothetical protein GRAN_1742 [Granulicella sibirica]
MRKQIPSPGHPTSRHPQAPFRTLGLHVVCLAAILSVIPHASHAQVAGKPSTQATNPAPAALTPQPYKGLFTKPSYPTTERKQNQFTVEFVYRFFEQAYSPAVPIHVQPKSASLSDTPEHVLVAQISAATAMDYETWLATWDTKSQQLFHDDAVTYKHDPAFWKRLWQRAYQGREITLVKRLETGQYVILEYRIGPPPAPGKPDQLLPGIFKLEGERWVSTRALDDSGVFAAFDAGGNPVAQLIDFEPVPAFSGQTTNFTEPQQLFFKNQPHGAQSATRLVW